LITQLEQVKHSLSKIKTLSVIIQFWCFIPFWNQERKKITFRINLRQSGQVRLSLEGFLAVLFVLRYAKPFWNHKVMIQRVTQLILLTYLYVLTWINLIVLNSSSMLFVLSPDSKMVRKIKMGWKLTKLWVCYNH